MAVPTPFIAEIRTFAFGFAPEGWSVCDGLHLPILDHQSVFAIVGWRFGGDGWTTFALPDLRAEMPSELVSAIAITGAIANARGGHD